ncbi:periplasmic sensor signal transduction histidine kinase [Bacteroides helcogenes P 36-108]|uniref:Periplasmic sensor signal transduction histidine kinase n=1 Tax=Bacteroides helcogenes (strain ATCC 35417 / DSM 20613 / JCM 6297 / CCUG 15421 / P 36-108) TaxID=693979 RepID=E6STL3_BACT6|nr:periplasmic sensor signal transduction histidine kinase [Bacteroides helcogenes P 36-108]
MYLCRLDKRSQAMNKVLSTVFNILRCIKRKSAVDKLWHEICEILNQLNMIC